MKGMIFLGVFLVVLYGVLAAEETITTKASVTVISNFISLTLDDSEIVFGAVKQGAVVKPSGDPLVLTVGEETIGNNIDINIKADSDYLSCVGGGCDVNVHKIPILYLKWNNDGISSWNYYRTSDSLVCNGLNANDNCSIYNELTIPSTQPSGDYEIGITITAKNVNN